MMIFIFLFKQKTAYEMRISDWSSDVCSSDLYSYRRHANPREIRRKDTEQQIAARARGQGNAQRFKRIMTRCPASDNPAGVAQAPVDIHFVPARLRRMARQCQQIARAQARELVDQYV